MEDQNWKCAYCDQDAAEDEEEVICMRCHQTMDKMQRAPAIFQQTKRGRSFIHNQALASLAGPLKDLVKKAMDAFDALPEEEQRAHRREQAISFVYGNLKLSGIGADKQQIADHYDRKVQEGE